MQKKIEITVPPGRTERLVQEIRALDSVIGLQLQRGGSVKPPGDILVAVVPNQGLHDLMRLLQERGVGADEATSISTSEPTSVISPQVAEHVGRETSDLTWEEVELEIGKESNMTLNALLVMGLSGALATLGIATDTLHVVVGAMAIAPGFEPITRISLGAVARNDAWKRGAAHTVVGYGALVSGAALCTLALVLLGRSPLVESGTYLTSGVLLSHWTSITLFSTLTSAAAGIAGALLVTSGRAILTAGVMIALGLVPSAALVGIGIAEASLELAARGALRWMVEVGLVAAGGFAVFLWKRRRVHERDSLI